MTPSPKTIDLDKLDYSKRNAGLDYGELVALSRDDQYQIKRRRAQYVQDEQERERKAVKAFVKALTVDAVYDVLAKADHPLDTTGIAIAIAKEAGFSYRSISGTTISRHLDDLLAAGRIERTKGGEGVMTRMGLNSQVIQKGRWTADRVGFSMPDDRSWWWWTVENGKAWDQREKIETKAAKERLDAWRKCSKALSGRNLPVIGLQYPPRATPDATVEMSLDLFTSLVALAGLVPKD